MNSRQPWIALAIILSLLSLPSQAQTLNAVNPPAQRVHEFIELTGAGFGSTQALSQVRFTDGSNTWDGGRAYLWRDNFIRIRVPVGATFGGTPTPIAKGPLQVYVQTAAGQSASRNFQVISVSGGSLAFRQLTNIQPDHDDTSTVLGAPPQNSGRTKDAEVADVNRDGWPDLIDNNSNNVTNGTHTVLRLNEQDKSFSAVAYEPLDASDSGSFPVEVPSGGDYFENHTSYDADYADINNDRLPDLLQTAANNVAGTDHRIRILMNGRGSVPGQFTEDTAARMPADPLGPVGCPDDVDHIDKEGDGDVDFLVTLRTSPDFCDGDTSNTRVFSNNGDGTFGAPFVISAISGFSTHDAFFLDANGDGYADIVLANEWNNVTYSSAGVQSQLFLGQAGGSYSANATFNLAASAGDAADFNADGLVDFVIGRTGVSVFLSRSDSPCRTSVTLTCTFDAVTLLAATINNLYYDFEPGDVDLDGDVDIIGARIGASADNIAIWINDGTGAFTDITGGDASTVLPGNGEYQRLSADLIDFDLDNDLDLYVTGQDARDSAPDSVVGFGRGPNQFFENLLVGLDIVNPRQTRPAYAGSSTNGRKVLVMLRATIPVSGLGPGDFLVSVDGTLLAPSATVTGGQIEEEYWLLVQMPAKTNGCYPLTVSLAGDPALADTENASVCYDDDRLFARSLATDRTRSMHWDSTADAASPEKMEAARAAGQFFVNLTEDADQIGVTSFKRWADDGDGNVEQDELARTDFELKVGFDTATMTDNRALAIGIVAGLQPDGTNFVYETSIGAGLREAWDDLTARATAGHEREIILLSDGLENYPPLWQDTEDGIPPLRPELLAADPPVTVHTVAIGPDADAPLLQTIADETGGLFFNLYEGTGSFGLMSRLAATYKYIDEEIRDEQRFFYREGVPALISVPPATATHLVRQRIAPLPVPQGFESITVGFHWNRDDAIKAVRLLDPDFNEILAAPPTTTIHGYVRHLVYRIRDPRPGIYYYAVDVNTDDPFEFFAVASGITDLVARGRVGRIRETTPGHFEVPLRLVIGDFNPILHASVAGDVVLPDKTRIPITLFDDGSNEDARNLDGIYSRVFTHTMPGGYTAELVSTGVSSRNEAFTRYTNLSFAFPGRVPGRDHPETGTGRPGADKPCIPCQLLRLLLLVILLLLAWLLWKCRPWRAVAQSTAAPR